MPLEVQLRVPARWPEVVPVRQAPSAAGRLLLCSQWPKRSRPQHPVQGKMVDATGIEPVTPTMST